MKNDIPAFLLAKPSPGQPRGGGGLKRPFIDKGVGHLAGVIRTSYVQWETASQRGLFQALDPRVKVLFLAFFIVIVSLKKDLTGLSFIALFVLALAALSRLDLVVLYRRVLFFGFIFGFLVAFPSSVNIITKGDVVVQIVSLKAPHDFWIYHIPKDIGLTREGLTGVCMLTMRVVDSLSLSLLVLYTTPFPEIIRALKVMRVPDAFLVIINLAYKYIFIFARTVEDMYLARKSRQVGAVGDAEARSWIAGRLGLLFRKTQVRCEEIFKAMLSRGFSGEVKLHGFGKLAGRDWAAGGVLAAVGVAFLWI
jgi:cobalt/nickel transport system permease protein